MSDRLPPLTALRAFEAAARHLSFSRAAEELSVTPAALSFQIKSLETHLGAPLFRRLNRAVELTEVGRRLAPATTEGFGALLSGWRAARRHTAGDTLTVTAGPAFTSRWLAPRLFGFARAHPEIELRFVATLRRLDLTRDDVDVAIRFGVGGEAGVVSEDLVDDCLTPMMRPDLARGLTAPADLVGHALIHQDDLDFLDPAPGWDAWFRAAGVAPFDTAGPHFSQADHAIDAAEAGLGIVLGRATLAAGALADGRLVAPFDVALALPVRFRVLYLAAARERSAVRAFLAWLHAEAEGLRGLDAGRRLVALKDAG